MSSAAGLLAVTNPNLDARRRANFKPSIWGNQFLDYTPDTKAIEAQQELAKVLKDEIYKELVSVRNKPLIEQLCLIDSIERLGVAYHFEKEIEDVLRRIHEITNTSSDDLFLTSLRFRLFRQHGFIVSCDVFEVFESLIKGSLNEVVAIDDVDGILSLYEACYLRIPGEAILDEALLFSTSRLKLVQNQLSHLQKERVGHALHKALHRRLTRVESVHHIKFYEQDPMHNKTLLRFAKIDFNLLQSSHKKELSDVSRWWKQVSLTTKLPIRDRLVECHFWAMGVFYEPQYTLARKITSISAQLVTSIDDLYDAYGTIEELKIFTEAIQRWDKSYLEQLPGEYSWFYQTLILDVLEEMDRDLAPKGRSIYLQYAREEVKAICRVYLVEASWRHRKYIPTFDEYMEIAIRDSGYVLEVAFIFLDMEMADHDTFQWLYSLPESFQHVCLILRIVNDLGSRPEIDKTRGHASFMIESYMRQYEVSYEQARKDLIEKCDESWKAICKAMILPTEVSMPLLKHCALNLARLGEYVYDGGEDSFTCPTKVTIEDTTSLYVDPIPISSKLVCSMYLKYVSVCTCSVC